MNDAPTAPVAETPDLNLAIEVANSATTPDGENQSVTIDLSAIPADARLELLKAQVKTIVQNRVNVANVRRNKERAPFLAWEAYEAAVAADPLQTAVAKPEGTKPEGTAPSPLDTLAKANEAVADLLKGDIRSQAKKGEGKSRAPKDPLTAQVTGVVAKAVYEAHKGTTVDDGKGGTRKFTYPDALKLVGGDGIAYLNSQIDAKVAAVPEAEQAALRAQLEKARDTRYIDPARIMLGINQTKAQAALPSIL